MNTNISPPPPSSFRNNISQSSSGMEDSLSRSNSKSKRQSMNAASSSASAGPRPLHLALASVVNASPPTTSSSTSSPGFHTPNEADGASIIEVSTSKRDSIQSATSSRGQSPLPLSPTVASLRKDTASRKRSSISYIPSTPNSPSYLQTNRHDPLDSPNLVPSPLGMGSGLTRTNSLGRKGSRTPRSATFAERASTGSMLTHSDSNIANAMAHLKERPPLTLNEKHADLLHFIAQKESKCLELRSQLAVHEAELLQLKRKWEKIVNRGFEKALSPNTASSSSFSTLSSSAPSPCPPESTSPGNSSTGYFPTLNATNANAPATVVLEGIKESVQGMSRLIVAGLGSIAQVNAPPDSATPLSTNSSTNINAPLPLRLGAVSQRRANDSGHGQTESQSSSSTMMSAASNMTSSSFLSVSTTSSATSAASSSSMTDSTTKKSTSDADTESEFGEFTDGSGPLASTRHRSATLTEHLRVQDTGATPTMSPNPHFERRKLKINDPLSSSLSLSSNTNTSLGGSILASDSQQETDNSSKDDFDWDDAWDDPVSEAQINDHFASSNPRTPTSKNTPSTSTSASAYAPTIAMELTKSRDHGPNDADGSAATKGPLSPMPAIPGLAAMGMGASTPTTQQMSSWVGSVGKKWGEIKGSSAFTKNQKRASVLLSDIQQTFVSSLISPTSTSDSAASFQNSSYPTPTTPSSYSPLSSNASHTTTPATSSSKTFVSPNTSSALAQPPVQRAVSLIDDSDDESFGESAEDKSNVTMRLPLAARMMSASVMVPDSVSHASKAKEVSKTGGADAKDADDDEWNW